MEGQGLAARNRQRMVARKAGCADGCADGCGDGACGGHEHGEKSESEQQGEMQVNFLNYIMSMAYQAMIFFGGSSQSDDRPVGTESPSGEVS